MQHSKVNRIAVLVALGATLFVMLFSTIFISEHVDHNCTGSECPICMVMEQCSENLKLIGTAIIAIAVGLFLICAMQRALSENGSHIICDSLISQKIRMNN